MSAVARFVRRRLPWLVLILAVAGLCLAFPPIRFHSIQAIRESQAGAQPDTSAFAATFWSTQLLPAADRAADAATVVEAIASDRTQVRERFGRTVGVSSSYFLFLRGSGRVVSAEADSIGLSVGAGNEADIVVPLEFVFGNAVRDATGLLGSSAYTNAQEFNDISVELNQIVENQVLPEFQRVATVGKRVGFAGCVEVADEEADLKPLKLVPVYVTAE